MTPPAVWYGSGMHARDALLAAVLANPENDLPRLVFADWLEENGEVERARFIRAQVACEQAVREWGGRGVKRSEGEMTDDRRAVWLRMVEAADEAAVIFATHGGSFCAPVGPVQYRVEYTRTEIRFGPRLMASDPPVATFRGGFVELVECRLADWLAHGPALVRAHPVREVRLTDRGPWVGSDGHAEWHSVERHPLVEPGYRGRDLLPEAVYVFLHGGADCRNYRRYDTRDAAFSALSAALIALAKSTPVPAPTT